MKVLCSRSVGSFTSGFPGILLSAALSSALMRILTGLFFKGSGPEFSYLVIQVICKYS